jgi:hypothetical protein
MGDDFFLSSVGAPFCTGADTSGSSGTNCVRMVSTGECSGVCVACDEVEAERG